MKQLIEQLIDEYGISEHEANNIIITMFSNITQKIILHKEHLYNNEIKKLIR